MVIIMYYTISRLIFNTLAETTINFNQSTYIIIEDTRLLQPVLVLSNPSASDILVQVESFDINATGWYT